MRLEWTKEESPVFHLLSPFFFFPFATQRIAFISVCIHISTFSGPEQSGEHGNEPGARPTDLQTSANVVTQSSSGSLPRV